ncbi:TPA: hypothetical protein ACKQH2_005317 [Serratia marcescens]
MAPKGYFFAVRLTTVLRTDRRTPKFWDHGNFGGSGVQPQLREQHQTTLAALDDSKAREQAQAVELAQLRERLAATEKQLGEVEKAGKEATDQHRQQLAALQTRLNSAEKTLTEATVQHAAELRDTQTRHDGALTELKAGQARSEAELKARLETAEKALATATEKAESRMTALEENHRQALQSLQEARDNAQTEAATAREDKAALSGELKSLQAQNHTLSSLLAGRVEPGKKSDNAR